MPKFEAESPSLNNHSHPPPYPSQDSNSQTFSSNKENTPPEGLQNPSQSALLSSPSTERIPDSQPQSVTAHARDDSLAPSLQLLLGSVRSTLRTFFVSRPPHTIQRLAELVLYPTTHYRTLPAYLRALDRTVSVTSSADIFPLQAYRLMVLSMAKPVSYPQIMGSEVTNPWVVLS